ncbi:MAG TPA: hypothetical protein VHE61_00970, partial [Opitutaceae bacterium]|nr:hypothetical protein [Opitutaceae bacterium]
WTWEFHTYLIELDVSLRTARTNKRLAAARYFQPSARTLSAPEVVHALITRMFAPNPAAPKK